MTHGINNIKFYQNYFLVVSEIESVGGPSHKEVTFCVRIMKSKEKQSPYRYGQALRSLGNSGS
jgi:hypothetical protein